MKYCKVISTYFGPRHRRLYEIGWPGHGQQISGGESCLFNLKFLVDIEKNLDAGVSYDTIIVNQDNDYEEGNSWLESINGMETRCGRIYCISRENTGRNFAAYRYGYETFKNDYDFFMFIPDDHIMMAKNYYRESIKRYNKKIEEDNCAVLALTGTGIIKDDDQTIHAHDGISLIHKKYIEEHYEKIGPLAAATSAKNVISDNYEGTGIIHEHVTGGEIPFTNNFIKLGYKIVSFDGIHDCVGLHSSSLTKLEKYKTWRYYKGLSCRNGGWPIELNGEIFCAPIYNLLSDHPGGINISDFKIDESISTIVYKELKMSGEEMIPLFKVFMSDESKQNALKVLSSGFIGQGTKVDEFESELKNIFGNEYIVTTNSATSAEHLALHLLKNEYGRWGGLKQGDEVLCTSLTCTATNWPVLANNFKIKWVDVNPDNLNMDLDDLERKITSTTKVIYLVHWGGYPVDLDRVKEIQNKTHDLYGFKPVVIEDCAHAMGSTYKGKMLGNHGNICTYSFQAIKHITAVDGGMMILPHRELYDRAKLLRWYGIDRETNRKDFRCEEDIKEWGFKFHMNDVSAAVGLGNLKYMDEIIGKHRDNAKYYDDELSNVSGVTVLERKNDRESSFWIYSILVENRQGFMNHMKECNIMVSQVHERNDIHTCVSEFKIHLPTVDKIIPQLISIPVGWWVTKEQREYIVECIRSGW